MQHAIHLTHPSELKALLQRHGFSFSKSLGQNFLIDEGVLSRIVEAANPSQDTCALEIGPGAGTLTQQLAKNFKKAVAIEIDSALIPILEETMAEFENFTLIHKDVMEVELKALTEQEFGGAPFCVAANLPYYITTPIVMNLLESHLPVTDMTLMVQKEVAERMAAMPGSKNYGALSVAVQYYTQPSIVCKAEPHCFLPQPKVASTVIHLKVLSQPSVSVKDEKHFFKLVKSAFGQRRKTLLNALSKSPYLSVEKEKVESALAQMNLDSAIRGERLSLEEFARLSDLLCGI
ncbi:MAG: 16S rRNA (adenine(1518)-N(6)/adenine(1519)-N(6))-dimethyltransferase RsmA [Clostridia bacterium]|nr:16S rRNA (adenine(1518)-N(6)/adenine(1519)-N(6))-dimethyltransferase RsmA [Clostridia bacterium]